MPEPTPPSVPAVATDGAWLRCIECSHDHPPFESVRYTCEQCGALLEVRYGDYPTFEEFQGDGVWRYAAALPFDESGPHRAPSGGDATGPVSLPEGDTGPAGSPPLGAWCGPLSSNGSAAAYRHTPSPSNSSNVG